jgi:hypothetical protein
MLQACGGGAAALLQSSCAPCAAKQRPQDDSAASRVPSHPFFYSSRFFMRHAAEGPAFPSLDASRWGFADSQGALWLSLVRAAVLVRGIQAGIGEEGRGGKRTGVGGGSRRMEVGRRDGIQFNSIDPIGAGSLETPCACPCRDCPARVFIITTRPFRTKMLASRLRSGAHLTLGCLAPESSESHIGTAVAVQVSTSILRGEVRECFFPQLLAGCAP